MPDTISIYDTTVRPFFFSYDNRGPVIHSSDSATDHGRGQWRSAVCPTFSGTSQGRVHAERGRFSSSRAASFASSPAERAEVRKKERAEDRGKDSQTATRVMEIG